MEMTEGTDGIISELSGEEIQEMLDSMLGEGQFSFMDYVTKLAQGKMPVRVTEMGQEILQGFWTNWQQHKNMYLYLLLLAVVGAVMTNLSKLLQGKQVAETAFYGVYLLFFTLLASAFTEASGLAAQTLSGLLEFIKVLTPTYFISMSFAQGAGASAVYYEFSLVLVMVVDIILVKFSIPGVNLFFLLKLANELSEEEMFSKMAELISDLIKFAMKTLFGVTMGINVIQGLIVPVSAQIQNTALVKIGSSIPGVGNTISTVTSTVLCTAKLVKNAVGVAGVIAVFIFCAIPLLKLLFWRFGYQLVAAVVQPVSDKRIVRCLGAVMESVGLLIHAVSLGAMLFILSILVVSAMT